jgi:hypothetical protein
MRSSCGKTGLGAGAYFRNRNYTSSRHYYLTFFWITQDGDSARKLRSLSSNVSC